LVWDLRCSQWWVWIMWSESGLLIVWYIHGYECCGGAFWVCLHRPSDDCSSRSRPNCLCWPFTLHGSITQQTTISNLNIIHFSCFVSLCYIKLMYTVRQYIVLLFYIILWYEQKCIAGNIMKSNKVYSLTSVFSCFVKILKVYIF
jgi:hypothetical protein